MNEETFQVGWRILLQLRDGHSVKKIGESHLLRFGSCGLLVFTREACGAVSQDHDECFAVFTIMIIGNLAPVLKPRGEGVNKREGWVGDGPSLVDRRVRQIIYLGQCIGDGGAIVVLKEVLIWHSVANEIANGDVGDDGGCVFR